MTGVCDDLDGCACTLIAPLSREAVVSRSTTRKGGFEFERQASSSDTQLSRAASVSGSSAVHWVDSDCDIGAVAPYAEVRVGAAITVKIVSRQKFADLSADMMCAVCRDGCDCEGREY